VLMPKKAKHQPTALRHITALRIKPMVLRVLNPPAVPVRKTELHVHIISMDNPLKKKVNNNLLIKITKPSRLLRDGFFNFQLPVFPTY
jgi:hypothetical protein